MKHKHTPGPWSLEQERTWPYSLFTRAPDGEIISVDGLAVYGKKDTRHEANAREMNERRIADVVLRAAAPELLAACEAALALLTIGASGSWAKDVLSEAIAAARRKPK